MVSDLWQDEWMKGSYSLLPMHVANNAYLYTTFPICGFYFHQFAAFSDCNRKKFLVFPFSVYYTDTVGNHSPIGK